MANHKVYTRTGDRGTTSLVGGHRVSKADLRLEAYGTIDELSSHLGLLAAMTDDATRQELQHIQNTLFSVGTHLATDTSRTPQPASLPQGEVERLERLIDEASEQTPALGGFILPGGSVPAASAHVARTVCRRAERCIVALSGEAPVDDAVMSYVNRLSDYLFVLAKKINFNMGVSEIIWQKPCR